MQRHLPGVGDAIGDRPLELRRQRQHGAEHFAHRSEIIVGNPLPKFQQLFVEDRREIERFDNFLGFDPWRTIMQLDDDTREALLPERHQHPPAHDRLHAGRDGVGERHVQRHGESDVAEEGHIGSNAGVFRQEMLPIVILSVAEQFAKRIVLRSRRTPTPLWHTNRKREFPSQTLALFPRTRRNRAPYVPAADVFVRTPCGSLAVLHGRGPSTSPIPLAAASGIAALRMTIFQKLPGPFNARTLPGGTGPERSRRRAVVPTCLISAASGPTPSSPSADPSTPRPSGADRAAETPDGT